MSAINVMKQTEHLKLWQCFPKCKIYQMFMALISATIYSQFFNDVNS